MKNGVLAIPNDYHARAFAFPQETVQAEALEELILLMINGELEALKGS